MSSFKKLSDIIRRSIKSSLIEGARSIKTCWIDDLHSIMGQN